MKRLTVICLLLLSQTLFAQEDTASLISQPTLDRLWILISAALVFLMQAGFKAFEVGLIRRKNVTATGMKNLIDWIACCAVFTLFSFAFMFGESSLGIIGASFFGLEGLSEYSQIGLAFFIFQLTFAGTALTIVSGALAERTSFIAYLSGSLMIASIIYPIFGHWAWGNLLITENKAWLADLGFMDFAGSTVVHSLGAWVALVGVWYVGPRLGKYPPGGKINEFKPNNFAYSILGLFFLWLGWWGFNGGSTLAFDSSVDQIILNTNIAAAFAGLAAFVHSYFFGKENIIPKTLGGVLGGLVAITACCNVVTIYSSILIGCLAGVVHNISYHLLADKLKIDDPVGAIAVHGFCGVFGTLSVALFGKTDMLVHPRAYQFLIQLLGVTVCFVWAASTSFFVYFVLKKFVGLRVSPMEEGQGLIIIEGGQPSYIDEAKDEDDTESSDEDEEDEGAPSEDDVKKLMGL